MLIRNHSFAEAVLNLFDTWVNHEEYEIYVKPWLNGREYGFHLTRGDTGRAVAFANERNSDALVVYHGKTTDFDFTHRHLKEEFIDNAICFGHNDLENAVDFIDDWLKGRWMG